MNRFSCGLYPTILLVMAATVGCDGSEPSSLHAAAESPGGPMEEVSLGSFRIPLVGQQRAYRPDDPDDVAERNRLLLRFELFVLVPPQSSAWASSRVKTHESRLRDDVIATCRGASLDELREPSLSALKMQLADVVGRCLGRKFVRRVVLANVLLEAR